MIGARDLAFPRINLLSWYIYMLGASSARTRSSPAAWTRVDVLHAVQHVFVADAGDLHGVPAAFIVGFSLDSHRAQLHRHHAQDARARTHLVPPAAFRWAIYATSLIQMLATPVSAITLVLLLLDAAVHIGIFDPALGGDPGAVPAPLLVLLASRRLHHDPAGMGVISEMVTCFARKQIFGYTSSLLEPRHRDHRLPRLGPSSLRQRPVGLRGHSLLAALDSSRFRRRSRCSTGPRRSTRDGSRADADALRARVHRLFTIGGLTGLFLACARSRRASHRHVLRVAHFHYIMVGGAIMAYLGGLHFWWPKITGRSIRVLGEDRRGDRVHRVQSDVLPHFLLGYMGMPRRTTSTPEFQVLNVMSTAGASILGVGYFLPIVYLVWSMRYGPKASANPWNATGLEWQTPSPPPTHNFDRVPVVTQEAYDYEAMERSLGRSH
jgi:cytochrome c oxidase subunit 1